MLRGRLKKAPAGLLGGGLFEGPLARSSHDRSPRRPGPPDERGAVWKPHFPWGSYPSLGPPTCYSPAFPGARQTKGATMSWKDDWAKVVVRAWKDDAFKKALLADPA